LKIKLAILDRDTSYLNRIVSAFSARYAEKLEIYSFTDPVVAMQTLESAKIDVLVASDSFEIETAKLPRRCSFAYFVESADVESVNGQRAICKFQKADLIYRQILSVFSENAGSISGLKFDGDDAKIIAFSSVAGGVGASTMAAACAAHFASKGQKTLYLNLEKFGEADRFFHGEGQFDMSDIIYALKSKKANLAMKLESCAKQDKSGVYFYSQTKIALDMMEFGAEDILRLISEIKISGIYNYIILDMDFAIDKSALEILKQAHAVMWVADGEEISNEKIFRAYTALTTLEQNADVPVNSRIKLIYNKFSNKTGKSIGDFGLKSIGGAPRYEHASTEEVLKQLSSLDAFDKIIS